MIADAKRRFVKRGGDFIVGRCETRIAACTLGREFRDKLGLTPGDVKYVAEIFAQQGRPFDIRVTVGKFPLDWVVSTDAPMEVLDFHGDLDPTSTTDCVLEILQDGCIDGFVGWLNLFGGTNSAMLDTLRTETSWPPLFFPVFYPGQEVQKGDRIEVATTTFLESSEINPDYLFEGRIFRGEVCLKKFRFYSRHVSHGFRETPFYQELFPESG